MKEGYWLYRTDDRAEILAEYDDLCMKRFGRWIDPQELNHTLQGSFHSIGEMVAGIFKDYGDALKKAMGIFEEAFENAVVDMHEQPVNQININWPVHMPHRELPPRRSAQPIHPSKRNLNYHHRGPR